MGPIIQVVILPRNGVEILSPYDPVRCCCYDAAQEMISETVYASLFDYLESSDFLEAITPRQPDSQEA